MSPLDFAASDWWGLLIEIGLAIVWAFGVAFFRLLISRPLVNAAMAQLRIGRHTFAFSAVERAELIVVSAGKSRGVDLRLVLRGGPNLYIHLVVRGHAVLDAATRSSTQVLIEGSSVETANDRRNRMQENSGYVAYGLTREDALAMLRRPPMTDAGMPEAY